MIDFVISIVIFILFVLLGGWIAFKIPKIDVKIPSPLIEICGFAGMIWVFYEKNIFIQILISFLIGILISYLLNCQNDDKK